MSAEALVVPDGLSLVEQVDALARQLRRSTRPRRDLADALDWYLGAWGSAGLPTPALAVRDHLDTLARAAAEAEARQERGRKPEPVEAAWDTLPASRVREVAREGTPGRGRGSCPTCRGPGCGRCRWTGRAGA